jgi:alpha-mannosidase
LDSPQSPVPNAAGRYANKQIYPDEGFNLAFVADNVPSLGYKTYRIVPAASSSVPQSSLVITGNSIENRFFKVALNPQTGSVTSIYDKELGMELVDKNAPHQVNQQITRWVKTGKEESPTVATIRKGQSGPVYASLVVSTSGAGCPQVTQEIILYDKIKRVDFSNRVLKDMTPTQEIYFAFPFKMENPDFRFEGPLSVIKPLRDQFPGSNSNYYSVQHWADVSDGKTGITLSPVDAHLVMFGGLNSVETSQAHHGVDSPTFGAPYITELKKGHMYSFVMNNNFQTNMPPTQLGDVLFRYSVTSHKGNWIEGRPRDFGWAASNPLIPVPVRRNSMGNLPESLSFCQVDKPNVILMTLKKAEDYEGIIIRLNETEGRDTEVSITLPHTNIDKAYKTNLVEVNEKLLDVQGQTIKINVKAFGVETIRVGSVASIELKP